MPHVSLRVTDQEKSWMENYAKLRGDSLSNAIKDVFFEKLEDEYDLKIIESYEAEKTKGNVKYYSLDEIKNELDLKE